VHTIIEGGKTRLRPASWGFSEEELRRRYRWSLDEELQYWSGSIPGGRSLAHFRDTLAKRDWPDDGKRISYSIATLGGELIGMVSCYNIDCKHHSGELGVYLGEKTFWGHGYGTDAVVAFVRHLFSHLGFLSIYLHTYESNLRAQRSYTKIGFDVTERRRRYSVRLGYHDELRMTILRERFRQLHGLHEPAVAS
jgi:RimJ/RimL family protein N-acetyltransferase